MKSFSRREFLKLSSLLSLAYLTQGKSYLNLSKIDSEKNTPNIIVVVFDTFSARHMGLYGYSRENTPNINRFAQRATVFHQHYASAPYTTPGTASLLTGTHPWSHRALHLGERADDAFTNKNMFSLFREAGYNQVAYTHNPQADVLLQQFSGHIDQYNHWQDLYILPNKFLQTLFGNDFNATFKAKELVFSLREEQDSTSLMLSHFLEPKLRADVQAVLEEYKEQFPKGLPSFTREGGNFFVLDHAIDWIQDTVASMPQPFLGYFHMLPPHDPFRPRQEFIDVFTDDGFTFPEKPISFFSDGTSSSRLLRLRQRYDEYILYVDAEFGRLVDNLAANKQLDNTWIVLTSDHGELLERGFHGHYDMGIYNPVINVPLLISAPGQTTRKDIYTPSGAADLLPTLLAATNQPIPSWIEGIPLPPVAAEMDHDVFSLQPKRNSSSAPIHNAIAVLIRGEFKLIYYLGIVEFDGEDQFELFNIIDDPEELNDIYTPDNPIGQEMSIALREKLREVNSGY